MHKTTDIFPRLVSQDLSEKQKITFKNFCDEFLVKTPDIITYGDMWNYAIAKDIREIKHNATHTEIMKIMWGVFMKKDSYHSKVFYKLILRDETRKMAEELYRILLKKDWI